MSQFKKDLFTSNEELYFIKKNAEHIMRLTAQLFENQLNNSAKEEEYFRLQEEEAEQPILGV